MTRRNARENAFIAMFESSFDGNSIEEIIEYSRNETDEYSVDVFGENLIKLYYDNTNIINDAIDEKLKGWKASRLPKVSLAVLRISISEILFGSEPDLDSVIINEAVEIVKKFGDEKDYQFVNGVLGNIVKDKKAKT